MSVIVDLEGILRRLDDQALHLNELMHTLGDTMIRLDKLEEQIKNNKPRYGVDTTAIPRFAEARMKEIEDELD